jgi:ribokinase
MSVIVFGSLNTDLCYQLKTLPRPGETVNALAFEVLNGGKGANQALAAKRAGANSVMIGSVGPDDYGQGHLDALSLENVNTQHIQRGTKPTGRAVIYIDQYGENTIILNAGANSETSAAQLRQHSVKDNDILICQMEVNESEIIDALAYAKKSGARTILNLAPIPDHFMTGLLDHLDYLIVNEIEASAVYDHLICTTDKSPAPHSPDVHEQARVIAATLQTNCIITRGDKGAVACTKDKLEYDVPALPIKAEDIVDTTGAGDAFTGFLASALERAVPLEEALSYAAVAGSLACLKLGAQSSYPTDSEIRAHLE